jgi:hypothetical protein
VDGRAIKSEVSVSIGLELLEIENISRDYLSFK